MLALAQLERLVDAAGKPEAERDKITLQAVAGAFKSTLESLGNVANSWKKWGPMVLAFLGLGS